MHSSRNRWLVLICLASLAACGDDSKSAVAPVAEGDFFAQFTELSCDGQAQCCTKGSRGFDQSQCQTEAVKTKELLQKQATEDGLTYDPQVGGDCLAELRQMYSSCQRDEEVNERCDSLYHGTRGPGEACTQLECGRTSDGTLLRCARVSVSSKEGTCQAVSLTVAREGKHGQAGDTCSTSCTRYPGGGISCTGGGSSQSPVPDPNAPPCFEDDGLYCGPDSRCAAFVAGGEPCGLGQQCAAGFSCSPFTMACEADKGPGDACTTPNTCSSTTYCDVAAQQCEALKAVGQPCEDGDECESLVCSGGACRSQDDLTHAPRCAL